MLKLGEKIIKSLYLGDKAISKVFLGAKLIYQKLVGEPIFLDYVVFDGNSYIDTEYKPNSNSSVKVGYNPHYNTVFSCVMGTQDSTTANRFYALVSSTIYRLQLNSASYSSFWGVSSTGLVAGSNGTFTNTAQKTILTIDNYNKQISIESEELTKTFNMATYNATLGTLDCNYNLLLGNRGTAGVPSATNGYKGEISILEIRENGELVQDLRPCIDPKGVVCFYDVITKKYFYNQGTGTLTAGNVIKFIDYVTTDGNSYIDTEYCPNENTYIEYTFEIVKAPPQAWNGLFGSRQDTAYYAYNIFCRNSLSLRLDYGRYEEASYQTSLNTKYTMKAGLGEIYINDELVKSYTPQLQGTSPYPMYLGNFNNKGTPYATGTAQKIYPCKIKENNVLVRDLRPCVSNGVVGFYDMVTGKIFTNAGTGELKASPRFVTSILFDGACVVDTGISHQDCTIECDIRFEETGKRQLMGFGSGTGQYWGAGATGIFDYMSGTNALDRTFVTLDFNTTDITVTVNADGVTRLSSKGGQITTLKYRIGAAPTGVSSNAYWCTCEIWSNKAYVNGELIQDLRPYVDENNVACFKDLVTGDLFYNQGTGTLGYTE